MFPSGKSLGVVAAEMFLIKQLPIPFFVLVRFWPLAAQGFGIAENTKEDWGKFYVQNGFKATVKYDIIRYNNGPDKALNW